MNKLSKIFLVIIIILTIICIAMTISYFKMKKAAKDNLYNHLTALTEIMLLIQQHPELQDTDWVALENQAKEQNPLNK